MIVEGVFPDVVIATNYHVIDRAFRIVVVFSDHTKADATVVGAVRLGDVALLRAQLPKNVSAVHWGDSEKLQIGERVFAAGDPLGLGMSVTAGIVSALDRNIHDTPYDHYIQTDASINHGNSGGPLFDSAGDVVGMTTALISPSSGSAGLGFAMPSEGVTFVLDRLRNYGWLRPGFLGVKVESVTPDIANAMGLTEVHGVVVARVTAGSPAEKAGIRIGDVITRFGDDAFSDEPALLRDIIRTKVGTRLDLTIWRDGQVLTLPAEIAEWPRAQWDALNAPIMGKPPDQMVPPDLGLRLASMTEGQRQTYALSPDQGGVLITAVAPETPAAVSMLSPGDVILRVQNKIVRSAHDVQAEVNKARAQGRTYAILLVQPKASETFPGPSWKAVRIAGN